MREVPQLARRRPITRLRALQVLRQLRLVRRAAPPGAAAAPLPAPIANADGACAPRRRGAASPHSLWAPVGAPSALPKRADARAAQAGARDQAPHSDPGGSLPPPPRRRRRRGARAPAPPQCGIQCWREALASARARTSGTLRSARRAPARPRAACHPWGCVGRDRARLRRRLGPAARAPRAGERRGASSSARGRARARRQPRAPCARSPQIFAERAFVGARSKTPPGARAIRPMAPGEPGYMAQPPGTAERRGRARRGAAPGRDIARSRVFLLVPPGGEKKKCGEKTKTGAGRAAPSPPPPPPRLFRAAVGANGCDARGGGGEDACACVCVSVGAGEGGGEGVRGVVRRGGVERSGALGTR